jgi:hypothetical protein
MWGLRSRPGLVGPAAECRAVRHPAAEDDAASLETCAFGGRRTPAHKTALVKAYVASTDGMLTLHFLPGYAPELNPDELVWSHMKRTGVARAPLRRGEKLRDKIEAQLAAIKRTPQLVRSFFQAPTVAYITDW